MKNVELRPRDGSARRDPAGRSRVPTALAHGAIREGLLRWFHEEKRELPWRGVADPYRIWVSEVMLQQTTVGAVLPRYGTFLDRYPDVQSLAEASEDGVLSAWSGLGYYARARNLRRAAAILVRDYGGRLPSDPSALRRLPGFGEYMAAAVASLAYGVRVPAAEANVDRVVSRLFAVGGLAGTREHRRRIVEAVEQILPRDRPADVTVALMDLGQTICTPRAPRCPACPLRIRCLAARTGETERYPERKTLPPVAAVSFAAAAATRRGRTFLVRREGGWLAGLWEYPSAEGPSAPEARRALARRMASLGFRLLRSEASGRASHTIMRRRLSIEIFRAAIDRRKASPREVEGRWFSPEELESAAIPTLTRKIGRACGFLPLSD